MRNFFKLILTKLFLVVVAFTGAAQQGTVTGVITDSETGESLPGANIVVEGTTIGATSDGEGYYTLDVPAEELVLKCSFLGYEEQKVEIAIAEGETKEVNFELVSDVAVLEELIVIGYGVQERSDMTGSITRITSEEMGRGVLTDPIQGLQGKAPGVLISRQGGDPNEAFSVRIRGASALGTSTEPLYVVDGVPGVDPSTISPNDIESFDVLKDASASAIYGSRGAHGVVMITTKRGKEDEPTRINFESYYSIDNVSNRMDLLSADELRDFASEHDISFYDAGHTTDWQDEVFKTGSSQNYSLAVSGGQEQLSYRASISHNIFDGVVRGSEKERTIGRLNFDHTAWDERLEVSGGISGTFEYNDYIDYDGWGINDVMYQTYRRNPTDPVYEEDGDYHEDTRGFNYRNPVGIVNDIHNTRDAKRYFGYLNADLEIFENFIAGVNVGYTRDDHESSYFEPKASGTLTREGQGSRSYHNYESKVLEATLNYNTELDLHNFEFLGGYSFQEDFITGLSAYGREPYNNITGPHDLSIFQRLTVGDINSYKESNRLISFFGRTIYDYDKTYFLTATLRRDGSSRFGKHNEWGWFPSGSVMWALTNEDFLSDHHIINNLRLRAGIGITGNQEFGNYRALRYYYADGTTFNFETGEDAILYRFAHDANPDLKWEENMEINIGIDYGIFDDRFAGSFEFFRKNTYDLLGEYSVPVPPNVVGRKWANVGNIRVQGFEFDVRSIVLDMQNVRWQSTINFSTFTQEVISLSDDQYEWDRLTEGWISGPGMVGNWTQVVEEGMEIGTWYMPEFAGFSQDGMFLFYTEEGGVTRSLERAERRNVGSAQPDFEIGWSNNIEVYENWDLSFSLRGVYGHEVLNVTEMIFGNPTFLPDLNGLRSAVDHYEDGLRDSPQFSSYYLEDASFIRMDNLTLGYNIRNFQGIDNIRIYFASNNVFTLTNYTGLDPEVNFTGLSFGLDQFNVYPRTRSFTLGVNLSL